MNNMTLLRNNRVPNHFDVYSDLDELLLQTGKDNNLRYNHLHENIE